MKYFTKEWYSGDLEDIIADEIAKNYSLYIDKTYNDLPFVLKLLTKTNLHDGRVIKMFIEKKNNVIVLEGVFGDLESHYYYLLIKYLNASFSETTRNISLPKRECIEILGDEIELISKNLFSHRILFRTYEEIEIIFNDIEILLKNTSSEDYKHALFHQKLDT